MGKSLGLLVQVLTSRGDDLLRLLVLVLTSRGDDLDSGYKYSPLGEMTWTLGTGTHLYGR